MAKLINWLRWIDKNAVHGALLCFIVLTSLLPKFPLEHIEYTYIRLRIDDLLPLIIYVIFAVQWLRGKIKLNTNFLITIVLFWAAVFTSFLIGTYGIKTIVVTNIGLLHSLRRIEYMGIFFVASSSVMSEKNFINYIKIYLATLAVVCIYGLGQKFLSFPSIQSMNPAYVDGRLLTLNPEDRINSTFGGHFDLAAYLTFSMPILMGFYFAYSQVRYFFVYTLSLIVLLYTAARSSFIAYLISVPLYVLMYRKYKVLFAIMALTILFTIVTGDMAKRIMSTFQIKTVFVNQQTGSSQIEQKISTQNLPAGGYQVKLFKDKIPKPTVNQAEIDQAALNEAVQEAKRNGQTYNTEEINKRAQEIAKYIQPQRMLLCDISCATRLQLEWPRAIGAFMFDPLFGSGPSSITEATDNDLLRWLGETGIVGTGLFLWILIGICLFVHRASKKVHQSQKFIYRGFIFGVVALLINGLYIDVFEASKVAYNFWLIAGLYVGMGTILAKPSAKEK